MTTDPLRRECGQLQGGDSEWLSESHLGNVKDQGAAPARAGNGWDGCCVGSAALGSLWDQGSWTQALWFHPRGLPERAKGPQPQEAGHTAGGSGSGSKELPVTSALDL